MQLKTWLMLVRVLNCISGVTLISFQIWYIVALFGESRTFFGVMLRVWAPMFVRYGVWASCSLMGLLIIVSEFKYEKIVENFKFLQWLPGVALFNLFMASLLAFEFSTIDQTTSIVLASIFAGFAIIFMLVNCFKPVGSRGLLSEEVGIVV